jgi:Ca-activated chloride channel family protein
MAWHERVAFVLGLLLVGGPAPVRAQDTNQTHSSDNAIHVSVDRVNVGVTVTGSHGNFVKGLRREDFRIFDNGVEQAVTGFLSLEEPAQVVLMVECGPAALLLRKSEVEAANTFLASISPADRVAIVSYSKSPDLVLDFTADRSKARAALRDMNFMASLREANLTSSIAAALDWLAVLPGKKTIVLLSTGVDTSGTNWQIVKQKIMTSDVRIFAVSVAGELRKPTKGRKLSLDEREDWQYVREVLSEADGSLRNLSEATGGRVYFPKNTKELLRTYAEITQLVRHEYSLEFAPPFLDGRVHALKVKAKHAWYHVDHRQNYLAPPSAVRDSAR